LYHPDELDIKTLKAKIPVTKLAVVGLKKR
jgi:hypothetical protein